MSIEPETKVTETKENNQVNNAADAAQSTETPEQINWRKFREAREVERKQKEAIEKDAAKKAEEITALKAAMEALVSKPGSTNVQPNSYEDESEDQKIQKKIDAALADRERKNEEERRVREQQEFPQRLVQHFPDFDQVCSTANIDYMEFHYPEVAGALKRLPDNYDTWVQIYKAVKRFVPNTDSQKDQKKAEKNFNKPQSMAVSGMTPTGDTAPVMLDDKRRADNWKRMQQRMKGVR